MTSEQAYRELCDAIESGKTQTLVSRSFDPDNFGNFVIEYTNVDEERLIVCDRSQIFTSDDFEGAKNFRLVVPSLHKVAKSELLEAVKLDLPSAH